MADYSLREVFKQFGKKIFGSCVNSCVSESQNLPLAASQGKVLQDQITQLNSNKEIIDISSYLRIPEETLSYVTRTKLFKMGGLVFIDIVCNIKEELKANTFLSIGNLSNIRTSFPTELNCIGINYSLGIFPIRGVIDGYSVKIYNTKTMDKETQILLSGFIMMV